MHDETDLIRDFLVEAQEGLQEVEEHLLALEAGDGKALPSLTQIRNLWSDAVSAGYGEEDIASIHAYLEKYRHR